jgi:PAS domain S-box-containing protein
MMKNSIFYLKEFYNNNNCQPPSALLYEQIDSFYFAKDKSGVFVCVDQSLLKHFHMQNSDDILGKTDYDIQRSDLADKHLEDDEKIMTSGRTIPSKMELVGDSKGNVNWFQTTKSPLRNLKGEIIGVEGLSRNVKMTKESIEPYSEFKNVISFIQKNFKKTINIEELARNNAMSLSTFERKFKKHFGLRPNQFIKKIRIDHSCDLLNSGYDISQIALECGFCDQSYFTKEFKKSMGLTPRQFRLNLSN